MPWSGDGYGKLCSSLVLVDRNFEPCGRGNTDVVSVILPMNLISFSREYVN